ncbi:MAG: PA0069 family radical SAM protein [Alphaproteobacteria bacterium]|nr:PA0069 family radical SAM protein [Alphaproteobacteria bacterium]
MSNPAATQPHPQARRGRGAVSNASGRFEPLAREAVDDGWGTLDEVPPPLPTRLTRDASRSVIARNQSPDVPFEQSINPYRGCEHGCIYCFARPTHAYLGLSPGLDFETRLLFKPEAARLLAAELSRPGYRCKVIALGTNTDPYQPVEGRLGLTRSILQTLWAFRHPVSIVTKSNRVLRDLDILAPMAAAGLAKVAISVTTLERALARAMEPRAPTPERRLAAIAGLAQAGVPTAVMLAPLIPALNDWEIERVLEAAAAAGAREAAYVLLRLPLEIKQLFREWLAERYPDRAERVISILKQCRGGKDYDAEWGKRMTGQGPYASLLARRFRLAATRLALNADRTVLATALFSVPAGERRQLALF